MSGGGESRMQLYTALRLLLDGDKAHQLIDTYAHELAEKQRAWDGPDSIEERWHRGKDDAADLIDPEVSGG